MAFKVVHGGFSRYSAPIATTDATAFTKGRLVTLNSIGSITLNNANPATSPIGVYLEDRPNVSQVGPTVTLTKIGAPSGERGSMLLDDAVLTQDQNLESGIQFTPGAALYCSINGKVTTSGNSVSSQSPVIGRALSTANSGDPNAALTWFYSVTY